MRFGSGRTSDFACQNLCEVWYWYWRARARARVCVCVCVCVCVSIHYFWRFEQSPRPLSLAFLIIFRISGACAPLMLCPIAPWIDSSLTYLGAAAHGGSRGAASGDLVVVTVRLVVLPPLPANSTSQALNKHWIWGGGRGCNSCPPKRI